MWLQLVHSHSRLQAPTLSNTLAPRLVSQGHASAGRNTDDRLRRARMHALYGARLIYRPRRLWTACGAHDAPKMSELSAHIWMQSSSTRCHAFLIARPANVNAQRLRGPGQPRAACQHVMCPIPMDQTSVVWWLDLWNRTTPGAPAQTEFFLDFWFGCLLLSATSGFAVRRRQSQRPPRSRCEKFTRRGTWCRWRWPRRRRHGQPCRGRWRA